MRPAAILCAAMPFGYGPASKLIALARLLCGEARLVFVGRGPSLELVSRTPDLFEEIVDLARSEGAMAAWAAGAVAVLSVMDRDAGLAATAAGTPLHVVDSLLWMRSEVPAEFRGASAYWAQAFPGLEPGAYAPRPRVVGPLVAPRPTAKGRRRAGLVVHLGGSAAPDDRRRSFASYARMTLAAVEAAGLVERYGRVTVIGGAAVIAALESPAPDERVTLETLPSEEARERTAHAAAVLTAPGLTASLECFHDRTPTWFLPPQNYSQWCTLRRLKTSGVAETALHWEEFEGVARFPDGLPTSAHHPHVPETISRLVEDPEASTRLASRLAAVGKGADVLTEAQSAFLGSLGENGLDAVVRGLLGRETGAAGSASAGLETAVGNPA